MYPKWSLPDYWLLVGRLGLDAVELTKRRKKPKSKKNSTGPAKSESSIMCWSIRASGFRTTSVYSPFNSVST
jgi:hypothetical protein